MTLTTHAIVGAAAMTAMVSALGATPAGLTLGVAAGFASHFAIDAIPHWNESSLLRSMEGNEEDSLSYDMRFGKDFLRDLLVLSADAILGLALSIGIFSLWFFHMPALVVGAGVVAGQLSDALQFVYYKLRPRFMAPLQRFHVEMQKEISNPLAIGIELALVVAVISALKLFI